ncbi:hypothetical protein SNEBB_005007 [Seison nebaliae]|nr:hypothetical protein SNEBB_005007 [Seison nebaliae]
MSEELNESVEYINETEIVNIEEEEEDEEIDDHAKVMEELETNLKRIDYVSESGVFDDISRYLDNGGTIEQVKSMLVDNYEGIVVTTNSLITWLNILGFPKNTEKKNVSKYLESQIQQTLISKLNIDHLDELYESNEIDEKQLIEIISHESWRKMLISFYKDHPNSIILNETIKLMAEKGFEHEIDGKSLALKNSQVFWAIFKSRINELYSARTFLSYNESLTEVMALMLRSEQIYINCLFIITNILEENMKKKEVLEKELLNSKNSTELNDSINLVQLRISVTKGLIDAIQLHVIEKFPTIGRTFLLINHFRKLLTTNNFQYDSDQNINGIIHSLQLTYLHKETTSQKYIEDILIYLEQSSDVNQLCSLLKMSEIIHMLIDELVVHRPYFSNRSKYQYWQFLSIVGFDDYVESTENVINTIDIAAVEEEGHEEDWIDTFEIGKNREEILKCYDALKSCMNCLEEKTISNFLLIIPKLLIYVRHAVVAYFVIKHIRLIVLQTSFFGVCKDPEPPQLLILDEIAYLWPRYQYQILQLLYEIYSKNYSSLDVLIQIQFRRFIIERILFIFTLCSNKKHSWTIIASIFHWLRSQTINGNTKKNKKDENYQDEKIDNSLPRYAFNQIADLIAPPYDINFIEEFLHLCINDKIIPGITSHIDQLKQHPRSLDEAKILEKRHEKRFQGLVKLKKNEDQAIATVKQFETLLNQMKMSKTKQSKMSHVIPEEYTTEEQIRQSFIEDYNYIRHWSKTSYGNSTSYGVLKFIDQCYMFHYSILQDFFGTN